MNNLEKLIHGKIGIVPHKSLTGKALHYTKGQWKRLIQFLSHPELPIHNNYVEGQIRPFVLGRKAWLFADSTEGGHANAIFYSLLNTAKENGLNPYHYLCHVFRNIDGTPPNDLAKLLPFKFSDQ